MAIKVKYNVNENCTLEFEGKDMKHCFVFMSYAGDLFGQKRCGNCDSEHLRPVHRTPKGYEYYSVRCDDCRFELKFGQQKDGGRLFPKGWEPPFESDADQPRQQSRGRQRDDQDDYNQDSNSYDYEPVAASSDGF